MRMFTLLALLVATQAHGQHDTALYSGTPQRVSNQFGFTEGPAADKDGNIFFTDQPNNRIWKYNTSGELSIFLENAGRSNGTYFNSKGHLITCADDHNELWSINKSGKVKVLLNNFHGHTFNGPNDLWIDKHDGIYFTDPYYQRPYWTRKRPDSLLGGQKLYYLPRGKRKAVLADTSVVKPNGLIGTPDNHFLYVSDMGQRMIFRYTISKKGKLSDRKAFAPEVIDGMTIDERGNIYMAGKGITIYNPSGQKIDHIDIPEDWTANVCFGGPDKNILFITASRSVYILTMKVRGGF